MSTNLRLYDIIKDLKKTGIGKSIIPIEAKASIPIPVTYKDKVYVKFLYYLANKPENKICLYAPVLELTYDYITDKIVQFSYVKDSPHYEGLKGEGVIGYFPNEKLKGLTELEYKEKYIELINRIDFLLRSKIEKKSILQEDYNQLRDLFNLLADPCMVPYLEKLNPKFMGNIMDAKGEE